MIRIAGIQIPDNKHAEFGLTMLFGIGRPTAKRILNDLNIPLETRVKDLSETDVNRIREVIAKITTEGDLRRKVQIDIKRLQEINCYRGLRHRRRLPVRGQRTKTNARTRKGRRMTVANKKMVTK